ncbi:hypothetical protein OEZ86_006750 [Tetradesmus obliquus]|uniref:Uncharacterized protein n=2 Tax=Tetradesmus obliquus TaxID=3088 RepID=A0ABY8TZ02_TETOB|nr:hypothetical protein OEZ85_007054 [Tetradesmus obliquus]WIA33627.1 hypothetical protein OEZ86_006750 [Tetradesmus obliquus]|eukprot:jgi/Sobl393_1/4408/SZX63682.1
MDAPAKPTKPAPRPRPILAFVARVLQVVFCLACLACAAHWAKTWAPYRTTTFQVYAILQSVNFAIFISFFGILLSSFLLFAPRITPKLAEDLPGLVDLLISGIWSIFFLSMGSSIAAWGACKASSLCLAWKGTVGLGFLLFVLYAITAVLAALDLRDQLSALKEAAAPPAPTQAPLPTKKSSDKIPSRPASVAGSHTGSHSGSEAV